MADQNLTAVLLALPNPFTTMAFLPPDLAFQVTISSYVLVGSLSVLIWDILSNLHNDLQLLLRFRFNLPMATYFASRISTLAYLSSLVIVETAPIGRCEYIQKTQALYPITISTTSLLFFFRVRALYHRNRFLVCFFFFSWVSVVAGTITATTGISGSSIGFTKHCINTRLESYVSLAAILPTFNDTLMFCATTWGLMQNSYTSGNVRDGLKVMVFGRYLPAFSRAMLQDGQAYYATTIGVHLVTLVLFYIKSVPLMYRSFLGVPNVVLMNVMACFLHRKIRFGIYRETTTLGLGNMTTVGGCSGIALRMGGMQTKSTTLSEECFKATVLQDEGLGGNEGSGTFEVVRVGGAAGCQISQG